MRRVSLGAVAAVGVLALAALTACRAFDDTVPAGPAPAVFPAGSTMARLQHAQRITIGSKFDQPGFGLVGPDGRPEGFDVEIGKIVADALGIPAERITWVETPARVREDYLVRGRVDLITATYTINDRRRQRVDFAGPYYVAGQQIMTRRHDTSITGPESFRDGSKKVCSGTGTIPADTISGYLKDPARQLVRYDTYAECAAALLSRRVDAVTTDNVILTGFVARHPEQLTLVGTRFTSELYGIGLPKGDDTFRAFLNDLLERIVKDGRYAKAWTDTAGRFDPTMPEAPPVDRY